MNKVLIFTDLDGSLLDHDSYSFDSALPILQKIKQRDIPLILTTSKTRAEIEEIRVKLQNSDPFICENGAAIFFPKSFRSYLPSFAKEIDGYYAIILGKKYEEILKFKEKTGIRGFSDMKPQEIAQRTNLDIDSASKAKKREFSEPFVLENEKLEELKDLAKKEGLDITKGGRFYHLIGEGQDKAKAVAIVKEIYEKIYNENIISVGVGDSSNDIAMLKSVDIPILIKKVDGSFEPLDLPNLIKSKYPGSRGWRECVGLVLRRLDAKEIFFAALNSVLPKNVITLNVNLIDNRLIIQKRIYDLSYYKNIYLLGAGKASMHMAQAIYDILQDRIKEGVVVSTQSKKIGNIEIVEGSHPIPDQKSLLGAKKIIELVKKIDKEDLAIFLLSGGASALMEMPIEPISLQELQILNEMLLRSGADIYEINTVRKHLSLVKGGRLAQLCEAEAAVLVISDVIADNLEVIGSAPCYIDETSYEDAKMVLAKYGLYDKVPKSIREVIEKGIAGKIPETPKKPKSEISHFIVASNKIALEEGKKRANDLGYRSFVVTDRMCGDVQNVAKRVLSAAKKEKYRKDFVWLFGGETTVQVKGKGKGGRNQELVLWSLKEIDGDENITFLSAGTDGIDGNSPAAGAIADFKLYEKAVEEGVDIDEYLKTNDSFHFFKRLGNQIVTGYTGTNVMDIAILIKQKD